MKLIYFLIISACVLNAHAQRRHSSRSETSSTEASRTISRGRTRFSATPDVSQASAEGRTETDNRRITGRRRTNTRPQSRPTTEPTLVANDYEVREVVDEAPFESPRRYGKSRTITETHYEAPNAPKKPLFEPASSTSELPPEELIKTFGNIENDLSTEPVEAEDTIPFTGASSSSSSSTSSATTPSTSTTDALSESLFTSVEPVAKPSTEYSSVSSDTPRIENDLRRENAKSVNAAKPSGTRREPTRRRTIKTRVNTRNDDTTQTQTRTRSRAQRVREEPQSASSVTAARTVTRTSRRRNEIPVSISSEAPQITRTRAPSVFSSEEAQPSATRSRPGRKINTPHGRSIDNAPQKVTLDLGESQKSVRRTPSRRNHQHSPQTTTSRPQTKTSRRSSSRFNPKTATEVPTEPIFSKSRSRSRDYPINIDETKLEVLPLFETEDKIVSHIRSSRRRNLNSNEESVEMSATENDEKIAPNSEKKEVSTSTATSVRITHRKTFGVESPTQPSFKPRKDYKKPPKQHVKESVVVSKITEVTSRRTVGRRKLPTRANAVASEAKSKETKSTVTQATTASPRLPGSRKTFGNAKKRDQNRSRLTSSEEEIDESDNYPEEFKALIQAKKTKKVSRTGSPTSESSEAAVTKTTTSKSTIVTSSQTPNIVTVVSVVGGDKAKEADERDNELEPKTTSLPSSRNTRRRFTTTTTKKPLTEKSKRSTVPTRKTTKYITTAHPPVTTTKKDHRFHAKFTASPKIEHDVTTASSLIKGSYSAKPKGIYSSSRRFKDNSEKHFGRSSKNYHENAVNSVKSSASPPLVSKPHRFSARYRGDISGRGVSLRSTTSTPVYVPTIPTITPSTTDYLWQDAANVDYYWSFSRLN